MDRQPDHQKHTPNYTVDWWERKKDVNYREIYLQ